MAQGEDVAAAGLQAGFRRGAAGLEVRPQLRAAPEGSADTADTHTGGKGSGSTAQDSALGEEAASGAVAAGLPSEDEVEPCVAAGRSWAGMSAGGVVFLIKSDVCLRKIRCLL